MDPSNNNSFDSFGSNAGAGNGAGVGTGAGVGSGVAITSSNSSSTTNPGPIVSGGATAVNNYSSKNFPDDGITIGGGEKRSRKGLIIAGIVFFVLAIGGGLAALAAMNGVFGGGNNGGSSGNSGSGSSPSVVIDDSVSTEVAFNRYANYLVSGEVKDEVNKLDIVDTQVELDEKFNDVSYMNNLRALFSSFYKKFSDENKGGDNSSFSLYQIDNELKYLYDLNNIKLLVKDDFEKIYLNDGANAALEFLTNLNAESDDDSYSIAEMKKLQVEYGKALVEYWNLCKEKGCVANNEISSDCERTIDWDVKEGYVLKIYTSEKTIKNQEYDAIDIVKINTERVFNYYSKGGNE